MSQGDDLNQPGQHDHQQHDHQHAPQPQSGGGLPGWVFWILGLLVFNGLSYYFNWGWVLY